MQQLASLGFPITTLICVLAKPQSLCPAQGGSRLLPPPLISPLPAPPPVSLSPHAPLKE